MNSDGNPLTWRKQIAVDRPAGGIIRPYQRELELLGRMADLMWVVISLRLSLAAAGWSWSERYTLLAAIACVLFYLTAEAFNVYHERRSLPAQFDLAHLLGAWTATAFIVLMLGYAFKVSDLYSRLGVGTWFLLAPLMLTGWRACTRAALTKVRTLGYNTRRVAIVGASEQGLRVARTVLQAPWMGLELTGIFDDRAPVRGRVPEDLPCELLGRTDDLLRQVKLLRIDMVYVTLPVNNTERINALVTALSDTTTSLYFVPDMFLCSVFNGRWVRLGDLPAVSVFETPFYGIGGWIKRAEDLLVASLALLVVAVPMVVIAIAVRITSPGPVIFKQRRYGLDGREFRVWKFRTMSVCEDTPDLEQARRDDIRMTSIGTFLRRTSLDELPQLLNVLSGTMSMVGPRPHASGHNEYYRHLVKHYMIRHKVRPGITGWAQVNGLRGETDTIDKMDTRVESDLWYIRNWSLLLDLQILLLTLTRGWRDRNAY